MHKKFNYPDRESLSRMTNVDAQAIMAYIGELVSLFHNRYRVLLIVCQQEFPKIYLTSLRM